METRQALLETLGTSMYEILVKKNTSNAFACTGPHLRLVTIGQCRCMIVDKDLKANLETVDTE